MIMNKALLFNEDELNYDKYRPAYPKEVYDEIFSYALLHENSQLLEIGVGTGQATEPFLKAGCKVTAAEIGDKLSAFVGRKYRDYLQRHCVSLAADAGKIRKSTRSS